MVTDKSFSNRIIDFIIFSILLLSAFLALAPVVSTLAISLSDSAAVEAGRVTFIPVKLTFLSYEKIIKDHQFFLSFFISVERVILGCSINFVLMVMMSFPLSREKRDFPQRDFYMWFIVFTMLFSGGLIPTYIIISKLGMIDTIWSLVLPGAVQVFNIILLMNYFRSIPKELEEACIMDGGGPILIMLRIFLPLSLPTIATVMLFSMVGHWNSFFDGLIYMTKPENAPLQTYVYNLTVDLDISFLSKLSAEEIKRRMAVSNKTFNAAKVIVTMIPVLMVYPFLQKFFVKGIILGSIKG